MHIKGWEARNLDGRGNVVESDSPRGNDRNRGPSGNRHEEQDRTDEPWIEVQAAVAREDLPMLSSLASIPQPLCGEALPLDSSVDLQPCLEAIAHLAFLL
jgi:hypothetical protein